MKQHEKRRGSGSYSVEVQKDDVIYAKLSGYTTEEMALKLMDETRTLIRKQRDARRPIYLLIDVLDVTGQDSGARSAAKQVADFNADRVAVVGKRLLKMIGQYILKSGGMGSYSKVFSHELEARNWLLRPSYGHRGLLKQYLSRTLVALAALLPMLALAGWMTGSVSLTGSWGEFEAMNPVVAITLIGLVFAALITSVDKKGKVAERILLFLLIWSLAFGLLVFLQYICKFDSNIDAWLFSAGFGNQGVIRAAPVTGLCIALISVFLMYANHPKRDWRTIPVYGIILVLLFLELVALVGFSYDLPRLYTSLNADPMSFNTLASLILLTTGVIILNTIRTPDTKARRFAVAYWPALSVFLVLTLATGFIWQQSNRTIAKDQSKIIHDQLNSTANTIDSRTNAYISTLRDYKAFFASSNDVNAIEFDNFAQSAQLAKHYPGVIGISFIKNVPKDQQAAFIKQVQTEQGQLAPIFKTFTIRPAATGAQAFPLLYVSPLRPTSAVGYNLASDPTRLRALEKARDTGDIAATATIDLNAARGGNLPKRNGFFISIPIYKQIDRKDPTTIEARRALLNGTVNAYVEDQLLFNDILKGVDQSQVHYLVTDAANNQVIFETPTKKSNSMRLHTTRTIAIGGQRWDISIYTAKSYGISTTQQRLPGTIVLSGLLFSLLVALLIVAQTRGREQAYELASRMTEDLESERNQAVTIRQKDEAVLASIGDAVFAIDTNGIITLFNKACERVSGYTAEEAIGKPYDQILSFQVESTGKPNIRFIKEALAGKISSMKNHTVLVQKNGTRVQVADSAAPIYNLKGVMQGVIVVFRDVSKEYELDKAKTEFVSLASHQLRTPLSAINWYAEMLLDGTAGKMSKDANDYIREIYEGNQRMVELVNSLLDVSRLELGKLSNNAEPTDFIALVNSLEKELQTMIVSKKLSFSKKLPSKMNAVSADPKLLRMIVQNLLSNAVKYTPDNGTVSVQLRDANEHDIKKSGRRVTTPALFFSVADTGYGIPAAQQAKIFSKLFRADNVRTLDVEGTGLGLYIVKEVIKKLGGAVWFESKESVGTTFYVVLPLKTKHTSTDVKKA